MQLAEHLRQLAELECPICKELHDDKDADWRQCAAGHTFCRESLQSACDSLIATTGDQETFRCPVCRIHMGNDAGNWPVNRDRAEHIKQRQLKKELYFEREHIKHRLLTQLHQLRNEIVQLRKEKRGLRKALAFYASRTARFTLNSSASESSSGHSD